MLAMSDRIAQGTKPRNELPSGQSPGQNIAGGLARRAAWVAVDLAPGELIDKITILEIKQARLADPIQVANVRVELQSLESALERNIETTPELTSLMRELRAINETLWSTESEIRQLDRSESHGEEFVGCARRIFSHNERRAATKRRINELLGSRFVEEKCYAD
jgi:hypothetical protein